MLFHNTMENLGEGFDWIVKTNAQRELEGCEIDWSMLQHNSLYHSYLFFESKFPKGYTNIVGFDRIIEKMAAVNEERTPIKEYNDRTQLDPEEIKSEPIVNE